MFWQAVTLGPSNQLPGLLVQNVNDPSTYQTHLMKEYPDAARTATLPATPDHVTVTVHLQAIGDDVLGPWSPAATSTLRSRPRSRAISSVAAAPWIGRRPRRAFHAPDPATGAVMTCVTTGTYKANTTLTTSHSTARPDDYRRVRRESSDAAAG